MKNLHLFLLVPCLLYFAACSNPAGSGGVDDPAAINPGNGNETEIIAEPNDEVNVDNESNDIDDNNAESETGLENENTGEVGETDDPIDDDPVIDDPETGEEDENEDDQEYEPEDDPENELEDEPEENDLTDFQGDGTIENPYLIVTANGLRELSSKVNSDTSYVQAHYRLTANIDLNGEEWTPIGTVSNRFIGVFDGGGFTVSGLHLTGAEPDQGLFGVIANIGIVRRLGVDGTISGGTNNGGIAGNNFGTVENCYSTVVINDGNYAGGIVGWNRTSSKILNCYSTGSISGISYAGGITGYNSGTVKNCVSLVTSVFSNVSGRVNGSSPGSSTGNKALAPMLVNGSVISSSGDGVNGNSINIGTPLPSVFNGWDTEIWLIPNGDLDVDCILPLLK